ncbi:L,D-transpeptidase family protein [Donghicola sp. C2-DW-16]|uniref:L,D-transpeptidase family protein n=1 Tax=Donghicola mangrovi TaxID=2729614 RepID=A0ABX2P9L5_9RHOB|nr:L,D-transpeptidase family protein [Donghicola mangrovi]NVO26154.1 L,D-transpeptidase family protein [Donghicola mangrovi]
MRFLKLALCVLLLVGVAACSSGKFKTYRGPAVTQILVYKGQRKMYLMHFDKVLTAYDIHLGGNPVGHKQFEGDGKTPEGLYQINRRNPNSKFHLSLGVSYPNEQDVEFALSQGKRPGGDIFIHGRPAPYRSWGDDWTAGCIAVTDKEIEMIYAMVRDGTPILIYP